MFSEAEQIKLQSFLSDLEKDDSPPPHSKYFKSISINLLT